MTTWPPGIETVWFGSPVTSIGTPLIDRFARSELPLPAAPRDADAVDMTTSADIGMPATLRLRLAREAWETTWSGQPTVTAFRTSPLKTDGMLPVTSVASRPSPGPPRAPVLASVVVVPPKRPNVVARTTFALPTRVCAPPLAGHAHRPAAITAVAIRLHRTDFVCRMLTSALEDRRPEGEGQSGRP